YLPSTGTLHHLRFPPPAANVRVDTGVREGDVVTVHYDAMIAKLVVWDESRAAAVRRLRAALAACQVVGPTTNVALLVAVAGHPAFEAGETDTGFLERHEKDLMPAGGPVPDRAVAIACLHRLLARMEHARRVARRSGDPFSPWHRTDGWRLNDEGRHTLRFRDGGRERAVLVSYRPDGWILGLDRGRVAARAARAADGDLLAELDGARVRATVVERGDELTVLIDGHAHRLTLHDPLAAAAALEAAPGGLNAPMPGKVLKVLVEEGARVARGAPLVVLEAMKMEHTITAPADGRVGRVKYKAGDQVDEGAELLVLESE
ncbi:MAG: biotin/lipoyl-containing protein, partial [Alphaproteobacteria bacterium]